LNQTKSETMQIPLTLRLEDHEVFLLGSLAQQKNDSRHHFAKLVFRIGLSQLASSGECGDLTTESKEKAPA
jgi:hypothetical protein